MHAYQCVVMGFIYGSMHQVLKWFVRIVQEISLRTCVKAIYFYKNNITVVGSSLASLTYLLMPFAGPTDPVVHLGGLTGSGKSVCESRLGHLYPSVWCFWVVKESSFNV